jgi:hypothetical protein
MDELDFVDKVEFVEQDGADQAIEIAARHKAIFLVGHVPSPQEASAEPDAGFIGIKRNGRI